MRDSAVMIAARMLYFVGPPDPGRVHITLARRLLEIDRICRRANAVVFHKQVVAVVIEQWQRDNPDLRPYT